MGGTVTGWTTAPEVYDGFSTKRTGAIHTDGENEWFQVEMQARDYVWQVTRYSSGLRGYLSEEEMAEMRAEQTGGQKA